MAQRRTGGPPAVALNFPEFGIVARIPGEGNPVGITMVTPGGSATFTNKTITDPSNRVSARGLIFGGLTRAIIGSANPADVLMYDGTNLVFGPVVAPVLGTNTPFGDDALAAITSGEYNSAFGYQAAYNLTTGDENTAIGYQTLYYNDSGTLNTAIGSKALGTHDLHPGAITSYNANTACGSHSMMLHVTGSNNTAIGTASLLGHVVAPAYQESNVAIGVETLAYCYDIASNTACGRDAMKAAGTAYDNCAYGYQSLFCNEAGVLNNVLEGNCAYGNQAMRGATVNPTVLYDNCAFGAFTLQEPPTGLTGCCAFGYQCLLNNDSDYATAFGYRALWSQTSGVDNVAFGPIAGAAVTTGSAGTYIGRGAGMHVTTGNRNTFVGHDVGTGVSIGSNNTCIGSDIVMGLGSRSNCICIGSAANPTENGQFVLASAGHPLNTRTTPGAAGPADALPATPALYLDVRLNGTNLTLPLYAVV